MEPKRNRRHQLNIYFLPCDSLSFIVIYYKYFDKDSKNFHQLFFENEKIFDDNIEKITTSKYYKEVFNKKIIIMNINNV